MIKFREYFNYVSFGMDAVVTTKLCNYLLVLIIVFFYFFHFVDLSIPYPGTDNKNTAWHVSDKTLETCGKS